MYPAGRRWFEEGWLRGLFRPEKLEPHRQTDKDEGESCRIQEITTLINSGPREPCSNGEGERGMKGGEVKRGEDADDEVSFSEMGMGILETKNQKKERAAQEIFCFDPRRGSGSVSPLGGRVTK